jgi:N-acetyl-gamma-glutamyl-phosphate reductase
MPHVAPHFRGLTVTTNLYLAKQAKREDIVLRFEARYEKEPLIHVVDEAPWVSQIAHRHHLDVGGFAMSTDGRRVVVVATLDNLLKGAATQAMQNVNRALGFAELTAIPL